VLKARDGSHGENVWCAYADVDMPGACVDSSDAARCEDGAWVVCCSVLQCVVVRCSVLQ